MDNILVEIFLPAANASYDVYIPLSCKMSEVLELTAKTLSDLSDNKYKAASDAVFCDRKSGAILDINIYVSEAGLQNGSRLMLI